VIMANLFGTVPIVNLGWPEFGSAGRAESRR
jgi:hypothetical protein